MPMPYRTPLLSASRIPSIASVLLALACCVLPGASAAAAPGAVQEPPACQSNALALSEAIEPVVEAVTDGRPDRVPAAARRAEAWWSAHRSRFSNPAVIDSAMGELQVLATGHRAPLAARSAVIAANAALDACPESPSDATMLMRIDLAGMAGWLRAHGVDARFPRLAAESARTIGARLRARGRVAMANALAREAAATLAIPVRVEGNVRAANALLERVDDIEAVLLR